MKKILFILLSSLVLVSCEGYFDQLPKTELPAETFYTSYDAALRNSDEQFSSDKYNHHQTYREDASCNQTRKPYI